MGELDFTLKLRPNKFYYVLQRSFNCTIPPHEATLIATLPYVCLDMTRDDEVHQ
jgi:hypothetical protein